MPSLHAPGPLRRPAGPFLLALALLASPPAGAEHLLLPPAHPAPLRLDAGGACGLRSLDVARLEDGRSIAVWIAETAGGEGVFGRFLSADGITLGDEIELVRPAAHNLGGVRVSRHFNRDFAIAWSRGEGALGMVAAIELAVFSEDGGRRQAVDVQVQPDASLTGFAIAYDSTRFTTAVVWTNGSNAWLRRFDPNLRPQSGSTAVSEPSEPGRVIGAVDVAWAAFGGAVIVWEEGNLLPAAPISGLDAVRGRYLHPSGQLLGPAFTVNRLPALASFADGLHPTIQGSSPEVLVAWVNREAAGVERGVYAQRLDQRGSPIGDTFRIGSTPLDSVDRPVITSTAEGSAIAWQGRAAGGGSPQAPTIFAQVLDPRGLARSEELVLWKSEPGRIASEPNLRSNAGLTLLWLDRLPAPPAPAQQCPGDSRILVRSAQFACEPSSSRVCLHEGRFAVETLLRIPSGPPRYDTVPAEKLSDRAAAFSFWDGRPDNVEVMVKLLDATAVDGRFWFFSGALSNRDYRIEVRDLLTRTTAGYASRSELVSFADLRTFGDPQPPQAPVPGPATGGEPPAAGSDRPEILLLHGGRFRVTATWTDPVTLETRAAGAEALSDVSGYFWFAREDNPEVAFKLLDGRRLNDHFWAFVGGLTNRGFELRVSDTETSESWTYINPQRRLASHADTRALSPPPARASALPR